MRKACQVAYDKYGFPLSQESRNETKSEAGSKRNLRILRASEAVSSPVVNPSQHSRFKDRPVYGNPINFRGLRHEPVNENGVVFLFGMVARELGFLVEAVQAGFPDCEAKREIDKGKWQRVRIEFEFESRNFRDHGHAVDGCDMIVCWHHNWSDCPLEVLELKSVIKSLGTG